MPQLSGRIVVASHNAGKVREIGELLAPLGVEAISAASLGSARAGRDRDQLRRQRRIEGARRGQRVRLAGAGRRFLGLEVFALDGAPGVYSARWAGPEQGFQPRHGAGVARARREAALSDLAARFVCVLALAQPDGAVESFEGEARGRIVWPPRGDKGFGYDPIFVPDGHVKTFGEMTPDEKLPLTHRARAFEKLVAALR